MSEISFSKADLSKLLYIKVVYCDDKRKQHEIKTNIKFISDKYISVYFKHNTAFSILQPQTVLLKFVCDGFVYQAKTILRDAKKSSSYIFLTIISPKELTRRQSRQYYRLKLDRFCILLATRNNGNCEAYMSKILDVSAGGLLIHKLESMYDNDPVVINPVNYEQYNVVLILGASVVLKLAARLVRCEKVDSGDRLAFQFVEVDEKNTDIIGKFVTHEQLEMLKRQKGAK